MIAPHLSVPNSPIDRAIMVLFGFGFTFMLSTMARMGLKVLLDISEGFTDHLAFLPFIFPGKELRPPMLTCTSRTEGRLLLLFIWMTYGSITSGAYGGKEVPVTLRTEHHRWGPYLDLHIRVISLGVSFQTALFCYISHAFLWMRGVLKPIAETENKARTHCITLAKSIPLNTYLLWDLLCATLMPVKV